MSYLYGLLRRGLIGESGTRAAEGTLRKFLSQNFGKIERLRNEFRADIHTPGPVSIVAMDPRQAADRVAGTLEGIWHILSRVGESYPSGAGKRIGWNLFHAAAAMDFDLLRKVSTAHRGAIEKR